MIDYDSNVTIYNFPKGQMILVLENVRIAKAINPAIMFYRSDKAFEVGEMINAKNVTANIKPEFCIVIDAERAEILSKYFGACADAIREVTEHED